MCTIVLESVLVTQLWEMWYVCVCVCAWRGAGHGALQSKPLPHGPWTMSSHRFPVFKSGPKEAGGWNNTALERGLFSLLLRIALLHSLSHTYADICARVHEEPAKEHPPPSSIRPFVGDVLWEPANATHGLSSTFYNTVPTHSDTHWGRLGCTVTHDMQTKNIHKTIVVWALFLITLWSKSLLQHFCITLCLQNFCSYNLFVLNLLIGFGLFLLGLALYMGSNGL